MGNEMIRENKICSKRSALEFALSSLRIPNLATEAVYCEVSVNVTTGWPRP